eukprot:359613_1
MVNMLVMICFVLIIRPILVHSVCPFLLQGTPLDTSLPATIPDTSEYDAKVADLNIYAVLNDINELLTNSQDCWPADEFIAREVSYGPLFIRLAWHCSGTFRETDGVGGCAGGRQRFSPEASWDDNVNLDKARALLVPIKDKYGDALSWGDLMIFAGTTAILNMGGPVTEICAGRIDSSDGTLSEPLITVFDDCPVDGNCSAPMGADTKGLIYVNPGGVMGDPDPQKSAPRIREVFGRMGMGDVETVALIGGGHAFGKAHGACPLGPGSSPEDDPTNPWPGNCGAGTGPDTFTSGFEGQWTTNPLTWDNEFFIQLIDDNYTLITGPGGKEQWENANNGYMMLTTDLALVYDDAYKAIVTNFANDISALNDAFAAAWEHLVTDGGAWSTQMKCIDASDLVLPYDYTTAFETTEVLVATTEEEDEDEDKSMTDEEAEGWRVIGIVFICLFAVALIVVGWFIYTTNCKQTKTVADSDVKGTYSADVEAETLKQTDN